MPASIPPEPEQAGEVIYVGRSPDGRWLVQDGAGLLEGRFVSFASAMSFAEGERRSHHARLELASSPLRPLIRFGITGAPAQEKAA